jgi:hypothetical protein
VKAERTLFQVMAGLKMLWFNFLSSLALSSARWLFALAMSRCLSVLAIRSVNDVKISGDLLEAGEQAHSPD